MGQPHPWAAWETSRILVEVATVKAISYEWNPVLHLTFGELIPGIRSGATALWHLTMQVLLVNHYPVWGGQDWQGLWDNPPGSVPLSNASGRGCQNKVTLLAFSPHESHHSGVCWLFSHFHPKLSSREALTALWEAVPCQESPVWLIGYRSSHGIQHMEPIAFTVEIHKHTDHQKWSWHGRAEEYV